MHTPTRFVINSKANDNFVPVDLGKNSYLFFSSIFLFIYFVVYLIGLPNNLPKLHIIIIARVIVSLFLYEMCISSLYEIHI